MFRFHASTRARFFGRTTEQLRFSRARRIFIYFRPCGAMRAACMRVVVVTIYYSLRHTPLIAAAAATAHTQHRHTRLWHTSPTPSNRRGARTHMNITHACSQTLTGSARTYTHTHTQRMRGADCIHTNKFSALLRIRIVCMRSVWHQPCTICMLHVCMKVNGVRFFSWILFVYLRLHLFTLRKCTRERAQR